MGEARRPKLLFVVSSMAVGGPQKSLIGLLERLDPTSFEVHVLVLDPTRVELLPFLPEHVGVVSTPPAVTAATLPRGGWRRSLVTLLGVLPLSRSVRVVIHLARGAVRLEGWQRVRQKVWELAAPYLPRLHGHYDAAIGILGSSTYAAVDLVDADARFHWVRSDSRILGRDEAIEDRYFERVDGALAVSQECRDIYEEMYPRMRGRVRVYKNDIPRRMLGDAVLGLDGVGKPGALKVLTVSRLDPLKGLDLAVEASRLLEDRGVLLSWSVLGEGPQRPSLEAQIAATGQSERFRLLGTVLDIAPRLSQADLFVHPSRTEGRSNAVEEARSAGLPIVVTRYPTAADQITHGVDGIICDLSAEGLADAIARLAADDDLRSQLGAQAVTAYESERDDPNWLFAELSRGVVPQSRA